MTYSIIGRCARTGRLGLGITTFSLAVGGRCEGVAANVGVCKTQAFPNRTNDPLGIKLLAQGHVPTRVMEMFAANDTEHDYRQIAKQRNPWQRFVPETAYRMHHQSRLFIDTALKADPVKTVVVTHHLPHARSIPPRFTGDLLNAAYASDLSGVIEVGRPALWVHGHTHDSCDYMVGDTRIVCNPRGYDDENARFDPMLVVRV